MGKATYQLAGQISEPSTVWYFAWYGFTQKGMDFSCRVAALMECVYPKPGKLKGGLPNKCSDMRPL